MVFHKDKLDAIVKPRSKEAIERARSRKENREWLRMSQEIALALHYHIRNAGMTQKEFAEKLGVSPVYVGKLLKGEENLTLETICKLQEAICESIVSIAKPYVSRLTVTLPTSIHFPANAANSDRYVGVAQTQNGYILTDGAAA